MKTKHTQRVTALIDRYQFPVRFSETDAMQVVWHGEYIRYFENGRESFGRHYSGLAYKDYYDNGVFAPIVDVHCEYKLPLTFGEEAIVETRYIDTKAAKIEFEYTVYRASDGAIAATGSSIQVFIDGKTRELELENPKFYLDWKERWIK